MGRKEYLGMPTAGLPKTPHYTLNTVERRLPVLISHKGGSDNRKLNLSTKTLL
jgi:hypothetical protein